MGTKPFYWQALNLSSWARWSRVAAGRFVHISAVERAGLSSLNEGQVVEYEEVSNKGKTSAENLKVQR